MIFLLVPSSLSAISSSAPYSAAAVSGFDAARLALIPKRMAEAVARRDVAGTVVLVTEHGRAVLFDAQGLARLDPNVPMRRDTIFQIMSMTKPIVAMGAMILAERGLLRLDDPVERWIPAFAKLRVREADRTLRPVGRGPTVRQLMTHTAGLGGNDPGGMDDDAKRKLLLGDYVERLPEEPLVAEPGERIAYSGLGFSTLGRIVELASGQPLERFLAEAIFDPLGLKDTAFFLPESKRGRAAWVYVPGERGLASLEPNPYREGARLANPAGGLYSTADDVARILRVLVEDGKVDGRRILSPAGARAMTTLATGTLTMDGSDGQGYGLGFAVVRGAAGQTTLKPVGTFGHTGAFGTEFWGDRRRGVVAVFLTQALGNGDSARKTFDTMVNAAYIGATTGRRGD